jgi:uncharacterized protein YbjQ (UPF0145 family)
MSTEVAPGWYADPQSDGQLRYWDGNQWTEHVQPQQQGPPEPQQPQPPQQAQPEPPQQAPQQQQPVQQQVAAPAGGGQQQHGPAYEAGSLEGVPTHGRERIEQLKGGFFTSDLSVNEFLLVKEAGFEPLGLVVGSSIYHIGFQQSNWSQNQEMEVLSQAMYQARELAMTRMEEEADQLGADGIVGVRLDIGRYEWGQSMAEFIAIGTAVKHREGVLHRAPNGRPFTSDLNGQDFWTLLRAGYRPVGLVMGSCVYHVAHQGIRQMFKQAGQNVELPNYTQALYDARELAMERMQYEAQQVQAEGIVGVQLNERSHGWGSHVIEFFAVGTGIVPTSEDHTIEPPQTVLTLNDR